MRRQVSPKIISLNEEARIQILVFFSSQVHCFLVCHWCVSPEGAAAQSKRNPNSAFCPKIHLVFHSVTDEGVYCPEHSVFITWFNRSLGALARNFFFQKDNIRLIQSASLSFRLLLVWESQVFKWRRLDADSKEKTKVHTSCGSE